VKHLIAQNLFEDLACREIALHRIAVRSESPRGRFLSDMKKRQHRVIRLFADVEVIETMPPRRKPRRFHRRLRWERAEKRRCASPEQQTVPMFIGRMQHVEPAKERIGRQLRGTKNVAPAVDFRFSEPEQLLDATFGIAPDPAMDERE